MDLLIDICYLTECESINTEQTSLIQRFALHEHICVQFPLTAFHLHQCRICSYSEP